MNLTGALAALNRGRLHPGMVRSVAHDLDLDPLPFLAILDTQGQQAAYDALVAAAA